MNVLQGIDEASPQPESESDARDAQLAAALEDSSGVRDDAVLACLGYIAQSLGKPVSYRAALHGLPLADGRLTPSLVPRAAQRLGLVAKLVQRSISKVPAVVAPFIVLFDSGDACVVLRRTALRRLVVVFPLVSDKPRTIPQSRLQKDASGYLFYVTAQAAEDDASSTEGKTKRRRGHWLWSAVSHFWPSWIQIVFAALVLNCLGLAFPLFVMNVYDRVIPNLAIPTLIALGTGVVIAIGFDFLLKQLRAVVLDRTGRRVDMKVASDIFEHALGISMTQQTGSAGAIANQIREFESVRDFFTSSAIIAVTDLLFIGIFIAVLWLIAGPIALVPMLAVPVVLVVTLLVQAPLSRSVRDTQMQASRRHSILVESLIGVETIKTVAAEGVMQRRWENAVAATARANTTMKFWSSLAMYFTATVQQGVGVIIIFWGVFLVADGELTVGGLIAANILSGRVLAPLGSIAQTFARAQQAFVAMRGLTQFMGLSRERPDTLSGGRLIKNGEIEFRNVGFAYPNANSESLKALTFKISAGERVGIIGRVGSGKTTVGKLMCGLFPPTSGTLLVDGVDIQHYETADLRAEVGFVSQDPELFAGTIRENIVLGKPTAREEEIAEVVKLSGVDSFTATHPNGLSLAIGERGNGLSGGQKQAVALARMLLRRPKILFLDEPSSAMDTTTESTLIASLKDHVEEQNTLVVCTHRGSFLEVVDRLLVIENGQLVADGPKERVLEALRSKSLRAAASEASTGDGS